MVHRICTLSDTNSFFLFGPRGTGKSTLLKSLKFLREALWIDLLNPNQEEIYSLRPGLVVEQAASLSPGDWIVIDEVQKIPKLLDIVHGLIEERRLNFALTGSSSRKLKRGGANLLAGRAFVFSLFPFAAMEIGKDFDVDSALRWGTLPKLCSLKSDRDRSRFLRTYAQTYIKEEIVVEQLIRNLDPFRLFLPVAAQMSGEIVNYSNIAKDTGVDYKTIQQYFQILVETYLGFFLEPYGSSIRKVQIQSPKFYFFDQGVQRSLQKKLTSPVEAGTPEYGRAFESWFINECYRMNSYLEKDFSFSYLRTKDGMEVDLIVKRPDESEVWIEIKSSRMVDERHIKSLKHFKKDKPHAEFICASQVKRAQKIDGISILPWKDALKIIGLHA
ncbi:MAG: hypothetical protein A2583_12120 [Bdellovibrionales bacterium RIFOXYD1_FULL_53_11]|nr:MAG: hypothetical protein A2583_12120 [Bdellovibrionales bacterium RIFOXYD1_FULL_53_11]